jgi:hypothetical protein
MVKISLAETDYIVETLSGGEKETFHILHGTYNGKKYLAAVVSEGSVILEGEEALHLKEKAVAIYLRQRTVLEQAADFLKSDSVYIEKSNAVPEGTERELLRFLMD